MLPFVPNSQPQIDFCTAEERILLFGGARGGGKSATVCGRAVDQLVRYPGNRIIVVRKTLKALKRSTWTTLNKWLPAELVKHSNSQSMEKELYNGSQIMMVQADISKDPLLEELKSVECSVIALEEVTQLAEPAFHAAMLCKDRWVTPSGHRPPAGLWATCNPEIGWVKEMWYDRHVTGKLPRDWRFIQCLPTDNPNLPETYIQDMGNLPPDLQARYLRGEWTASVDPQRLIAYEWIRAAQDADDRTGLDGWISVDVAYEGDDDSVIGRVDVARDGMSFDMPGGEWLKIVHGADEGEVADAAKLMWLTAGLPQGRIIVDSTGIGSGVETILKRQGIQCVRFKGGERAVSQLYPGMEFKNLRDQSYWHLRSILAAGNGTLPENPRLIEEALSVRILPSDGRHVPIEKKSDVKRRLRRSPDMMDMLTMAVIAPRLANRGTARAFIVG